MSRSLAELTELVTEMDGTIRQRPWPLGRVDRHPRQVAPWPYRLVSRIFRQAATLLRHVPVLRSALACAIAASLTSVAALAQQVRALMFVERFASDVENRLDQLGQ